jgi:hypothetical protein
MTSEEYRAVEQKVSISLLLQADLVESIRQKLNKEHAVIERAVYVASVSTTTRPVDIAFSVNEFLAALHEVEMPEPAKETNP